MFGKFLLLLFNVNPKNLGPKIFWIYICKLNSWNPHLCMSFWSLSLSASLSVCLFYITMKTFLLKKLFFKMNCVFLEVKLCRFKNICICWKKYKQVSFVKHYTSSWTIPLYLIKVYWGALDLWREFVPWWRQFMKRFLLSNCNKKFCVLSASLVDFLHALASSHRPNSQQLPSGVVQKLGLVCFLRIESAYFSFCSWCSSMVLVSFRKLVGRLICSECSTLINWNKISGYQSAFSGQ